MNAVCNNARRFKLLIDQSQVCAAHSVDVCVCVCVRECVCVYVCEGVCVCV